MEDVLSTTNRTTKPVQSSVLTNRKALRGHERDRSRPDRGAVVANPDHHYKQNGKQRIHLSTEPLTGWVNVEITEEADNRMD